VLIIREAKGNKDRVVMLPRSLVPELRQQLQCARMLWECDRAAGHAGVQTPHALDAKYPRAGQTWVWFWPFPAENLSTDPQTGVYRRHHLYPDRVQRAVKRAHGRRVLPSTSPCAPCATPSPRTCSRRVPISAPCRNWFLGSEPEFAKPSARSQSSVQSTAAQSVSDPNSHMIYTHVLKVAAGGTASPLDALALPA
jgi:hypothetical protein